MLLNEITNKHIMFVLSVYSNFTYIHVCTFSFLFLYFFFWKLMMQRTVQVKNTLYHTIYNNNASERNY